MESRRYIFGAFAVVLLGLALMTASAMTQGEVRRTPYFSDEKLYLFETNLIIALQSEYPGLEASAAQTLRELKVYNPDFSYSRSVIPLMHIVKTESGDTRARLCAILALHDLKSDRGDYAIATTAKFSGNTQVQRLCSWLAYTRQVEKTQAIVHTIEEAVLLAVR